MKNLTYSSQLPFVIDLADKLRTRAISSKVERLVYNNVLTNHIQVKESIKRTSNRPTCSSLDFYYINARNLITTLDDLSCHAGIITKRIRLST